MLVERLVITDFRLLEDFSKTFFCNIAQLYDIIFISFLPGVRKLIQVAAQASCIWSNSQSSLAVDKATRMHVSVALSKLYDSLG